MLEVVAMAAAVAAMTCPDRIFSPVHQLTIQWVGLALTRPWHRQTMKWAQCLGNMDSRRDTTRRPTIGDVCLLYLRLQQDLQINLAGVALALDLLDEIESLRALIYRLE